MKEVFFDPNKSIVIKTSKTKFFKILEKARLLRKLFGYLFIFFFLISSLSLFEILNYEFKIAVGLTSLSLGTFFIFFVLNIFWSDKIKNLPIPRDSKNIADFLEITVARSISEVLKIEDKSADSNLLTKQILKNDKNLNFFFGRLGIPLKQIKRDLNYLSFDETNSSAIEGILLRAFEEKRGEKITSGDIIISLSEEKSFLSEVFKKENLDKNDIINVIEWKERIESTIDERKKFWEWTNLIKKGSLARDWASGYSLLLDSFSTDWTKIFKKTAFPKVVGHEKETKNLERVLSRKEINNALIVGEVGTGRKSMIYEIARRSFFGESLPEVNHKRIIELDVNKIFSQTEEFQRAERIIDSIFKETVSSGNIIIVINDIHKALKNTNISFESILSSYLPLATFQIIATTDFSGYYQTIEKNNLLFSYFEKIEISEISEKETLTLLEDLTPSLELKDKKFISYQALKEIIHSCEKYIPNIPFPKKATDLLDEAMVHLIQQKEFVLLPHHIHSVVSQKAQIPIGTLGEEEKDILLQLEDLIHKRVVNQEEAVNEVCSALRRSRSEISDSKKPMGSFLFLGPTGVGKTETAKALAESYFGAEKEMVRIDMSEFQAISDIGRLIGASKEEGILTSKVKENPFSLILLDEIEKAHPDVLNIFLQVMDDGHLTDGFGKKIDFKHTIIIATSNAGYKLILKGIEDGVEWHSLKKNILDFLYQEGTFRPEFINRFDAVVLFKTLSKENLLKISEIYLQKIKKNLQKKNIKFEITEGIKEKIVEIGYNPIYGARELKRAVQDKIENILATAMLSESINSGDRISINPDDFSIIKVSNFEKK